MAPVGGQGRGIKWIREHLNYQGDDCLPWPMSRQGGYGNLGYKGKMYWAHRLMCEMAHGAPPTPSHQAAHECGNGICVNPRHLFWKTPTENQLDRRKHGTLSVGRRGKITFKDAQAIRALRGSKTYPEIAAMYGLHPSSITHIMRGVYWTREERKTTRSQTSG